MSKLIAKVAIIGVGLIGGSLGLSLKHRHLVDEITGFDLDDENISLALSAGAIDKAAADLYDAVKDADLVVLATPILTIEKLLGQIADRVKPNTIITDVGSTKERITAVAEKVLPPEVYFVGGHPMAGSEVVGMRGAHPYLFENAYYLLTPTPQTNRSALKKVRRLIENIGARVVEMSPQKHDAAVAVVSHLPYLMACALANNLEGVPNKNEVLTLAAGGFRDMTRIAASSPVMWRDIFQTNSHHVLQALDRLQSILDDYRKMIVTARAAQLEREFARARENRLSLPKRSIGYLPTLFEVLLTAPDRPGVIANFSTLLGEHNINITDIEILRVREGQGGTIRLAFATEKDQLAAVQVLTDAGYQAHIH